MDERKRLMEEETYRVNNAQVLREAAERTVRHILEQEYRGKFAIINVVRKGNEVRIRWEFYGNFLDSSFYIKGLLREMTLFPDPSYDMDKCIVSGHGNGSVTLSMDEGTSYYIEFFFVDTVVEKDCSRDEFGKQHFDVLFFQVAVPLADEHKHVLQTINQSPEERARKAGEEFLRVEDAFDESLRSGIESIKKKNLPKEEEEQRISRLIDHIKLQKENAGH